MGKSVKKTPITKDNSKIHSQNKKRANKSVRAKLKQDLEMGNGSEYKKHYESYDIADYVVRWTKEEAISLYYNKCSPEYWSHSHLSEEYGKRCAKDFKEKYPTLDDFLQYWERTMRRK